MRIAINCHSFLNQKYTGIGRYTYNLLKYLAKIDSENDYLLYVKRGLFQFKKKIPHFSAPNFYAQIDHFKKGPRKVLKSFDIFHAPSPDFLSFSPEVKMVVTVHDLIFKTFPQGHTEETVAGTQRQFESFLKTANKFICCSLSTACDLKKFFSIPDERISLVYQGVDHEIFYKIGFEEEADATQTLCEYGLKEPFLLFVGTVEPRKNLENVLRAFAQLKNKNIFDGKLAVIGSKGWMSEGLEELMERLQLRNNVLFLGYVPDDQLRHFYNRAEIFIFPSFYEGFGYPLVEAFCCGSAVVTSNVSSCAEIAEDAAVQIDPRDPQEIAQAIERILEDKAWKASLQAKALARKEKFSFLKTAQETLKVYNEVYQL